MHMTVTLVRLGDQRFFIASRDMPLGCHLAREPQPQIRRLYHACLLCANSSADLLKYCSPRLRAFTRAFPGILGSA
jgi:hypothetical protein